MTLDEVRNLDFKDMPNWPLPGQLAALCLLVLLVMGAAYLAVFSSVQDEIEQARLQEEQLRQTFVDKKRQASNLVALENQLKQIEVSFGTLLKQLPTKSEMDSLLTEINQAGIGRGLQFELFRPAGEVKTDQMAELPIQIRLTGTYNELAAFVTDVSQLSRIVTISDISLTPVGDAKSSRLVMMATAKTYRALEAEEKLSAPK
ncbi:type 4a pilus biogenesis protein PilO [Vogesella sp. XCS3]|jgi:type IV pilus assembly protein PilO|uniref:type 4a pilus biogenesis protein PilO n=1 Tax=Vogesella sp. XCS3 TaxID=2877939 RepID=UPI001B5C4087|nr:type 4a pilus biogenesis protein PilO [Vogesella sp. XCS3]MBP7580539.1 type 4a pilus biogenesis protein PilO [Vogesella sp.]UDM16547.1 type 4a pilus biogenesis protein PilO [Vogesella sp. XCS3]